MPIRIAFFQAMKGAYETGGGEVPGWVKARTLEEAGVCATCYINHELSEAIISFRGTVLNMANLRDDLMLAFGRIPRGFWEAVRFDNFLLAEVIPPAYKVTYVGHSLGAIYASLLACLRRGNAITLDSPGIRSLIDMIPGVPHPEDKLLHALYQGSIHHQTTVINYLSAPNVINTLHSHIGGNFRVFVGHVIGMSGRHVVKCVASSVKRFLGAPLTAVASTTSSFAALFGPKTHNILMEVPLPSVTPLDIIINAIVKVIDYSVWLSRQHSVANLLEALTFEPQQESERLARVVLWPRLTTAFPHILGTTGTFTSTVRDWVAFEPNTEGVHTLFSENHILETRVSKIPGYEVIPLEKPESPQEPKHKKSKTDDSRADQDNHFRNASSSTTSTDSISGSRPTDHTTDFDRTPIIINFDSPLLQVITAYAVQSQNRLQHILLPDGKDPDSFTARSPLSEEELTVCDPTREQVVRGLSQLRETLPRDRIDVSSAELSEILKQFFDSPATINFDLVEAKKQSRQTLEYSFAAANFNEYLSKSHGFIIRDVDGDGNCFFSAIEDQLRKQAPDLLEDHNMLRLRAAKYMNDHIAEYGPFIAGLSTSPIEYLESMATSGEWADEPIINALARALDVTIVIIRSDQQVPNIINPGEGRRALHLGYYVGIHYVSLHNTLSIDMAHDGIPPGGSPITAATLSNASAITTFQEYLMVKRGMTAAEAKEFERVLGVD